MHQLNELKFVDILDPEEYLALSDSERANIKEEYLVPPSLNKNDFGKIQVVYKNPIFKVK